MGRNKSWPPQRPSSVPLGVFVLVLKLLVDNAERGEEVPQEEDEEGEAAHEDLQEARVSGGMCPAQTPPPRAAARSPPYLPLLALRVLDHPEESDGVVQLPELQRQEA